MFWRLTWFTQASTSLYEGVNMGLQIRRSVPFFRPIRQSADIFDQIRKINVNATVASNFAPNSEESALEFK